MEQWGPILDWAMRRYDAPFLVTTGINHINQPEKSIATLGSAVHALDTFQLSALSPLVTMGGSMLVALAVIEHALDAAESWSAVNLDERWQEERWGADADAIALRQACNI